MTRGAVDANGKSAAEVRDAMDYLKNHGFAGHFFHVPPELFDEFPDQLVLKVAGARERMGKRLDTVPGTKGLVYLRAHVDQIGLWAMVPIAKLTPKQRSILTEKYGTRLVERLPVGEWENRHSGGESIGYHAK